MLALLLFTTSALAGTNTNACLQLVAGTKGCFASTVPVFCSTNVANFNNAKCFCNDLALKMLDVPYQTAISVAASKYGIRPSCAGFDTRTYNGGQCLQTDTQLDAIRFFAAKSFAETIMRLGLQTTGCLDYDALRTSISKSVLPNGIAYAGQGLGTYQGVDHIAEYFSLLSPRVNHGFVAMTPAAVPGSVAVVADAGNVVTFGTNVVNNYLNNQYQRNLTDYIEMVFAFSGCDTRAISIKVPSRSTIYANKITGVASLSEMLFVTANSDQLSGGNGYSMLGVRSTCAQHLKFCTGANQQFPTFAECARLLRNLPRKSPTCGPQALLSGNTIACRAKHQFMVQIDPNTHCNHIGLQSTACSDSLCENPGIATDVNNEYTNVNPQLTKALYKINQYYLDLMDRGVWPYADYCPLKSQSLKLQIPGDNKLISLTEVQLSGADPVSVTASSIAYNRDPNLIINGKIDGNFNNGDVTHTNLESNPFVQIQLDHGSNLEEVTVFGRSDCCGDRMAGMIASVVDQNGVVIKSSPLRLIDAASQRYSAFGKTYLKLTVPGALKVIHLTEVVVNGVSATASSSVYGTNPNYILNGRIDGNFNNGDVFHSNADTNVWVKIELAQDENPTNVIIYGRSDCCGDRMVGMVATVEYADGTVIKSSPVRLLDAATQKYAAF